MGDIAELAKIEKRRARRQRRILESAESRLDKITCSQSALRQHTDATPVTTPPLTEKMTLAEHYPAPTDRRREKYEQSLSSTSSPILSERQLKKHRPAVRKLIEEEQANQLKERGFLGGYIPQSLIVTMLHRTSSQPKRSKHPANKYWHLMHMLCMMWLGSLAIFEAMSKQGLQQVSQWMLSNDTSASAPSTSSALYFPVFRYFVILEMLLFVAKRFYAPVNINEHTVSSSSSFLSASSPLLHHLQKNKQEVFTLLSRLFRDLCIVVFVMGFIPLLVMMTTSK